VSLSIPATSGRGMRPGQP